MPTHSRDKVMYGQLAGIGWYNVCMIENPCRANVILGCALNCVCIIKEYTSLGRHHVSFLSPHRPAKVTKVTWHMHHYGAPTPKPHWAFANSGAIKLLYKGPLRNWQGYCTAHPDRVRTSHRYVDKRGVKRYHGNKNLKSTE